MIGGICIERAILAIEPLESPEPHCSSMRFQKGIRIASNFWELESLELLELTKLLESELLEPHNHNFSELELLESQKLLEPLESEPHRSCNRPCL